MYNIHFMVKTVSDAKGVVEFSHAKNPATYNDVLESFEQLDSDKLYLHTVRVVGLRIEKIDDESQCTHPIVWSPADQDLQTFLNKKSRKLMRYKSVSEILHAIGDADFAREFDAL